MMAETIPGLLIERASAQPTTVAMRYFRRGKWNEVTYAELLRQSASLGAGLAALGVGPGDCVAVLSSDGPLAFRSEVAVQGIGAKAAVIDADLSAEAVCDLVRATGSICVLTNDQEQFDKIEEHRGEVPSVRLLVVDGVRGLGYLQNLDRDDRDTVLTMKQLESRGNEAAWMQSAGSQGSQTAARIRQGGTDAGSAQLVTETHGQLIEAARAIADTARMSPKDALFALRSLADPTEHALQIAGPLLCGSTLHFGSSEQMAQNIAQVQPTVVHMSERWLGGVNADLTARVASAKGLKRKAIASGLRRRAPGKDFLTNKHARPTRLIGLGAAAVAVLFLLVSVSMNDFLRLLIVGLIAVGAGLGVVLSGQSVSGPLRRRYGLSRCRGILAQQTPESGDILGALGIPLVIHNSEVSR